jgi:chemotaxis protein methyltransferase CheR
MSKIAITPQEFFLYSDFLESECGITLNINKTYLLEERLSKLIMENQCKTFGEFFLKAKSAATKDLRMQIVDAMTVNETLWFRDEGPYHLLRDKLFPELNAELAAMKRINVRIWSAACSTGQEPYSMSIMAHEAARLHDCAHLLQPGRLSIVASDISPTALNSAKAARYDNMAMTRGMWPDVEKRYFTPQDDKSFVVKDAVRSLVRFEQFNLKLPFITLGRFDVIFIRNVSIYFSLEFKKELYQKIAQALNPGGYLVIGSSETLLGISDDFELMEHERTRYYRVKPLMP